MPIYIYIIGGYIKKYNIKGFHNKLLNIVGFLILLTMAVFTVPILSIMNQYVWRFIWGLNISAILLGVFLFFSFFSIRKSESCVMRWFTSISRHVFGVYLFHNGRLLILLIELFRINENLYHSCNYIIYMIIASIIVFFIGTLVDYIRMKVFEPCLLKIFNPFIRVVTTKLENLLKGE